MNFVLVWKNIKRKKLNQSCPILRYRLLVDTAVAWFHNLNILVVSCRLSRLSPRAHLGNFILVSEISPRPIHVPSNMAAQPALTVKDILSTVPNFVAPARVWTEKIKLLLPSMRTSSCITSYASASQLISSTRQRVATRLHLTCSIKSSP